MMRLYLLRHGIAEEPQPGQHDSGRKLTQEGIEEMQAAAHALKRLRLNVDTVLTSPYPRAQQTAEIVAEALGIADRLNADRRLAAGCRFGDVQEILHEHPGKQRVMIVGHNPDLTLIAQQLTGGAGFELVKGGLARVDLERFEPGSGVLHWLLTPKVLIV